jgi:toxin ParE1/3/4
MRLVIRAKAADDLASIHAWISRDNVRAAHEMVRRIRARIGYLTTPGLAYIGRPGRDEGTRELIEHPYIVVYEVNEKRKEIIVLAVFHGAQSR